MVTMWLERAELGDAGAQFQLGYCFENGHGTAIDLPAAAQWYRRSAQQGHELAQCQLGLLCASGVPGQPWDPAEACKWLTLAARKKVKAAQDALRSFKASPEQWADGERMAREFIARGISPETPARMPSRPAPPQIIKTKPVSAVEKQLPLFGPNP